MWSAKNHQNLKIAIVLTAVVVSLIGLAVLSNPGSSPSHDSQRWQDNVKAAKIESTGGSTIQEKLEQDNESARRESYSGMVITAEYLVSDVPSYPEFELVGYTQEFGFPEGNSQQEKKQPMMRMRTRQQNRTRPQDFGSPPPPARLMMGVDGNQCDPCQEPRWRDADMIPWEQFSFGEYIGPHRTPHVPEYRVRVRDQLDFVFMLTREQSGREYRLGVGDTIAIVASSLHSEYNQPRIEIIADGSISLPLVGRVMAAGKTITDLEHEVNARYIKAGVRMPEIVIQGVETNRKLQDLRDAVDARAGVGGQSRFAEVGPDGTIQLPLIHSVPAVGLTLKELAREVNARYREKIDGIEVTPILVTRAPRVAYVLGEVAQPGRIELEGPTSAIQSIALAQGWNPGGNLRQVIIFRRDQNWNLMATRLDLAGALHGRRPHPSDEIWLRDGDIVLVPKQPIQRLADAVDLYLTRTVYALLPNQGFGIIFDGSSNFNP